MSKIDLIILVGFLAFSGSCERKPSSSGAQEKGPYDSFTLLKMKDGEGLKIRCDGESDAAIHVFKSKGELIVFRDSSKDPLVVGSPFIAKVANGGKISLWTTVGGKLEEGGRNGTIRYCDLDGDGLPDFKQDINGVYKRDSVIWSRSEYRELPNKSSDPDVPVIEVDHANPMKMKSDRLPED